MNRGSLQCDWKLWLCGQSIGTVPNWNANTPGWWCFRHSQAKNGATAKLKLTTKKDQNHSTVWSVLGGETSYSLFFLFFAFWFPTRDFPWMLKSEPNVCGTTWRKHRQSGPKFARIHLDCGPLMVTNLTSCVLSWLCSLSFLFVTFLLWNLNRPERDGKKGHKRERMEDGGRTNKKSLDGNALERWGRPGMSQRRVVSGQALLVWIRKAKWH